MKPARLTLLLLLALVLGCEAGPIGLISLKPATAQQGGGGGGGGASARLLDFSQAIPLNSEGDPVLHPYLTDNIQGGDPDQTASVTGGVYQIVVGANSSPYALFLNYPYNTAQGYTKHSNWLKAGETWQANTFNRLSFGWRCTNASYNRTATGYGNVQFGTYIRGPQQGSASYQGAHFYHHLDVNVPQGLWIKTVITPRPTHQVGGGTGVNWPYDYGVPLVGRAVQTNSTSQSTWVRILYADGRTPVTSYTDASVINFTYQLNQNTGVAITTSELGAADAPYSSGGMYHVGIGYWRIDVPNGAWTSAGCVSVGGSNNSRIVYRIEHTVSAGATNTSPNLATETAHPGNWADHLTHWYFDWQQLPDGVGTWQWMDFRFYQEPASTPREDIANFSIYYTGTRYEVDFMTPKNLARTYEFRYRTDGVSMRSAGFTSGTSGGTVAGLNSTYTNALWTSPNMSESTSGIYVAWRVQGETDFEEVYFPYQYGPGNDGFSTQYGG